MKRRITALGLTVALMSAFLLTPVSTAKTPSLARTAVQTATNPFRNIPITGTVGSGQNAATFIGTLNITSFAIRNNQLVAIGTVTGTLTNAAGTVIGTITRAVQIQLPVTAITGTCQILHLELGPIDLNLLGLMVHVDRIVIDITAQTCPTCLLGNLLCAIAGLLGDPNTTLRALVDLLNQLLAALGSV